MTNKHCPRSHRGYYREDDDLSVHDGAVQNNKDWSTYRKTDTFIVICAAIVLASIIGGGIAIGVHFATGGSATGSAGHDSGTHIVPRFPAMQYNAAHINSTHHGINSTLSDILPTGTLTLCSDDAEETVTGFMNQTTADTTTTIKMTRTRTLHQSAKGTTVSSAKAVNATLSGPSAVSESVPIVTQFITTSVTKTAYLTATATESHVDSEPIVSMSSTGVSTSEATPSVEPSSADIASVILTKTLTEIHVVTSAVQEVTSTFTYTPTTIILSTVTVDFQPSFTPSLEAQCSPEVQDHTVYVTVTEAAIVSSSSSALVSSKISKTTSSAPDSETTDTILITYTVTVDSLTPISEMPIVSSSYDVPKHSTKTSSRSKATQVVTEVATQTVYVSVADGTTLTFSTAVSSAIGHVGTPALTSTETSQASTATDVVVITKTVTDQVFETVSASPASSGGVETHIMTDTQTSVVTITASDHVQTSLVTVNKNLTATVTQSNTKNSTASIFTDVFRLPPASTTIYITGTPMLHPRPTTDVFPPYPITNGTVFRPTAPPALSFGSSANGSGSRPPASTTVVVVSNAEKRAEPVMFSLDAATGGCKSCTTCLVIFVLGLLVLF
ncbi:hypothetical protein CGRA01v4_06890 [Colletotrichum graminicola]|uniref:Uncharacterized protein n=1 Tax=Colletotrichum graminicola (strain M1.001 / M2 / FGSC 10212) TaxID=645133 RepID=E3Q2N8_COLGM|nr:uncharacterized protein GLRG_00011 [Colletotrichum graminicola M1.001]EFQ24867.1 hypothetical protein GLRG_00011 [Colletotrichum graminicola M1.001]WDK15609.1 hypothetical protein CGRA01v4_06890 [Colletotrichum graminicola]